MKSIVRRLAITAGAASLLVTAGATTGAIPSLTAHAAGATALHCVISGTATISPGLGAPPGGPQSFSYTGSATCNGVLAGNAVAAKTGSINGSGTCSSGSLVTCAQVGTPFISCALSVGGGSASGVGTYVQTGANITVECSGTDSGGGAVVTEADAVFTPNPPTQTTVQTVNFDGTATVHSS